MERTISIMVGKGTINHNRREFIAPNVDADQTYKNVIYCNEDIRDVYHKLFDNALERYNAKQKRKDRKIKDYFEKIKRSKQEKLFHEIIIQIGNKDDMGVGTYDGVVGKFILDDYFKDFQERNPNLKVFGAYLHMDEQTPHLHIDFVPFTTESKRGLDTRVSLKGALEKQGFIGKSREETEWRAWVESEKEALAKVMERYSVYWHDKGTHEKHLTVLDFKKKEREKEVRKLEEQINEKRVELRNNQEMVDRQFETESLVRNEIDSANEELKNITGEVENAKIYKRAIEEEKVELQKRKQELNEDIESLVIDRDRAEIAYSEYEKMSRYLNRIVENYENGFEYRLPEATGLMSAKTYKEKYVEPLLERLKNLLNSLIGMLKGLQYRVFKVEKEN